MRRSLSCLPELLQWLDTASSPFLCKVSPPSSKQVHFFVWSQYFPPRQWRLLFRPWLLSKLTWLNWLQANELLDWSCQAPQEVMLLHLWGATPATAAICCLGMSQGLKKKEKKKSKLQKAPQALCVFWSAVSDDTLRWTHTCTRKESSWKARQKDRHPYIHNVIFASWLAMSHSRGPVSLPEGTAVNQNGLVWLVRHLMSGEVVLRVYPKCSLSSIPALLSFVQKIVAYTVILGFYL